MIKNCQNSTMSSALSWSPCWQKHGTGPKFVLAFISLGISSKKTSTGQQVGLNTFPGKMFLWKQLISDQCCGFTNIILVRYLDRDRIQKLAPNLDKIQIRIRNKVRINKVAEYKLNLDPDCHTATTMYEYTEQIQIFKMRSCLTTKLVRILLLRSVNPGKERCSRCGGRISIEYISQQI